MKNERKSERRILRLIAFGVILYAALMNLNLVSQAAARALGLIAPILLGLAMALIFNVPMQGFEHLFAKLDRKSRVQARVRRMLSLILSVVTVPLVIALMLKFIVPQFINAVTNLVNIIVANEDKIEAVVAKTGLDPALVQQKINEAVQWITSNLSSIAGAAVNTAVSMFSSAADVVLAFILSIYVLADKAALGRRVSRLLRAFLPERGADYLLRASSLFSHTFGTFLGRQCLESLILGSILLLGMVILRVPYAVTIACVTALLALLPYVGAYISLFIGVVLVVTVSPMKALIFAILFLVAQQVEGNLIYPRVVGKSVGLPAYVTLGAVMLGGAIAGIPGMFFIIPLVSVAYTLLRESVGNRMAAKAAARTADNAPERDAADS